MPDDIRTRMNRPSHPLRRRPALLLLPALAACGTARPPHPAPAARGRVVLFRGLLNLFSTGIDVLAASLRQAGWSATTHNHSAWRGLADRTAAEARDGGLPRPLVVIGHSFGADAAILFTGRLGARGIATDLLVTFDPSWVLAVPRGPRRVLNFHQDRDGYSRRLQPENGFDGTIENRLVNGHSHLSIEKDLALHRLVLDRLAVLDGARVAPARPPGATAGR
jgi:hypothetical protein